MRKNFVRLFSQRDKSSPKKKIPKKKKKLRWKQSERIPTKTKSSFLPKKSETMNFPNRQIK